MKKNKKQRKKVRDQKLLRRKLIFKENRRRKRIALQKLSGFQKALFLRNEKIRRSYDVSISCPEIFSLLHNKEEFIRFINKLEGASHRFKSVYFDMIKIKQIDFSGITCLISILLTYKKQNINFEGSLPIVTECRNFLLRSDFFSQIANLTFHPHQDLNVELRNKTANFITKGSKKVSPDIAGDANIMVSKRLFDSEEYVNDGLQVILLELMANTNNHASNTQGQEHWFLSVQLDDDDVVRFTFVDYGVGIFKSLETKELYSKLKHFFTSNHNCLKQMLQGLYHIKSSTGLNYRGKGIPSLKTACDRNHIGNLVIISNDAYGDVQNSIFAPNTNNFNGTFLSWEVTKKNEFININV